jgi:hypothetical protein
MIYQTVHDVSNDIEKIKGDFIRFEGMGIMDGLKLSKRKSDFYKIIGADSVSLHLRGYRAKRCSELPFYHWNQKCEIINNKEFKTLPVY